MADERPNQRAPNRTKRVPTGEQGDFLFKGLGPRPPPASGEVRSEPMAAFQRGERHKLRVGELPLEQYLIECQMTWVIEVVSQLESLDLSGFEKVYKPGGRPPIYPRIILGLVIYGMLVRHWSLRELEALAARDVGAWWVTGGLRPDHSTIGKFLVLHSERLSEQFFLDVTSALCRKLDAKGGDAAIDGTVIESAASRLKMLKAEAAREAANEAAARAKADPRDLAARADSEAAEQVALTAEQRAGKRKAVGKDPDAVVVAPSDPEAVAQPLKNGAVRPSYKPSVAVNEQRLITGQSVTPWSETQAVQPLLEQHKTTTGAPAAAALMDAGYHSVPLLKSLTEAGTEALCPEGKAKGDDGFRKAGAKFFLKKDFSFDEAANCYRCPGGKNLMPKSVETDGAGRTYRRYTAVGCAHCPLRAKCIKGKRNRSIKRYEGEEYKEAMNLVFKQPAARARYRRRQAMVEPVFAELRERQRLTRFKRRGLRMVRVEFALHCTAYNLKRAVRLVGAARRAAGAAGAAGAACRAHSPGRRLRLRCLPIGMRHGSSAQARHGALGAGKNPRALIQQSLQEGANLVLLWRDRDGGGREGLLLDVRACANPACPCRDALVTGFTFADTLVDASLDPRSHRPPHWRLRPGSPVPRLSVAAKVNLDTLAVTDWPEVRGSDQSAVGWLQEALGPELREALGRRFAATKPAPPSDDDWKAEDWSLWTPGTPVYWGEANPKTDADWIEVEGREYEAMDQYRVDPGSDNSEVVIDFLPEELGFPESMERLTSRVTLHLDRPDDPELLTMGDGDLAQKQWAAYRAKYEIPALLAKRRERMLEIGQELHRRYVERTTPARKTVRAKPNEPCPCGSGKKHKRCCM